MLGLPKKPAVTMLCEFKHTELPAVHTNSLPRNPIAATHAAGTYNPAKRIHGEQDGGDSTTEEGRARKRARVGEAIHGHDDDETMTSEEEHQAKSSEQNKNRHGNGQGRFALPKKPSPSSSAPLPPSGPFPWTSPSTP